MAFKKAKSAGFGLFWNCLPEIKCFGHLAIFWPFWKLKKIVPFKAYFGKIWAKITILNEILNLDIVILTNFWRKFGLFSFLRIWPFWNCLWPNLAFLIFLDLVTLIFSSLRRSDDDCHVVQSLQETTCANTRMSPWFRLNSDGLSTDFHEAWSYP